MSFSQSEFSKRLQSRFSFLIHSISRSTVMFKHLLLSLLMFATLNLSAIAQLEVVVTKIDVLVGAPNARVINSFIVFDTEGSKPLFTPAALIDVKTQAKFVKVKARKSLFETTVAIKVSEYQYMVLGTGKYAIEVTTFDTELGIDEETVSVDLGQYPSPDPEPDPEPTPIPTPNPVPDDQFNNLGKKAQEWSKGLPKRKELGSVYREASKLLTESPITTINDATVFVADSKNKLLGSDAVKYNVFFENLNADLRTRWPLSRGDLAAYMLCVAVGLEN